MQICSMCYVQNINWFKCKVLQWLTIPPHIFSTENLQMTWLHLWNYIVRRLNFPRPHFRSVEVFPRSAQVPLLTPTLCRLLNPAEWRSGSLLHSGPVLQWSANTHTTLIPPPWSLSMVSLPFFCRQLDSKKRLQRFWCTKAMHTSLL